MDDYVEFLKFNNASDELINKIINIVRYSKNEEEYTKIINNLYFVYEIFNYIGFTDKEINNYLNNFYNSSIITYDKSEIIKIAYVLNEVGVQSLITNFDEPLRNGLMYKRIFMRDFYSKLTNNYDHRRGLSFLSLDERKVYGYDFSFASKGIVIEGNNFPKYCPDCGNKMKIRKDNVSTFMQCPSCKKIVHRDKYIPAVSSDAELEVFLNKILVINNKHISVDKYIEIASMDLYKKFFMERLKSAKK